MTTSARPLYLQAAEARRRGQPDAETARQMGVSTARVAHMACYARERGIDAPKLYNRSARAALRSLQAKGAVPRIGNMTETLATRPAEDVECLMRLLRREDTTLLDMLVRVALEVAGKASPR